MLCSISGTVPEEPVVSKKTGHLFEKRLVEKIIKETGRCPVTDQPLEPEDLIPLASAAVAKPRPAPATSVPGLLSLFQNEWDSTMLEVHQLRGALASARQELSHALYQHDAAVRVIARLSRERDAARAALEAAEAAAPAGAANGKRAAAAEPEAAAAKKAKAGITPDVAERLSAVSAELSKGRKKRAISPTLATPEQVESYALSGAYALHKTSGKKGILAIDLSPESDAVSASAGADGVVVLYDRAQERVLSELKGHTKPVTDVRFVGSQSLLASTSADRTLRLWRAGADGAYAAAHTFSDQAGEVVSVAVHPSNQYLVTAATDGTWAFYDLDSALCLAQVADEAAAGAGGYSSAALHPDGLILATGGADSAVRIWETRTQKAVAKFEGHSGPVGGLSFSENGYYMASAAADGVKLWDLRKLKNFKSLTPYEPGTAAGAVAFDHSGLYLAVGGPDARVYGVKQDWAALATLADVGTGKAGVHALRFGADARALLVGAADHKLRVFAPVQ